MLKIQILTKNNIKTIENTFQTISNLKASIFVGDFGSEDGTVEVCKSYKAKVFNLKGQSRDCARNKLIELSGEGPYFFIEPWEGIVSGHSFLSKNINECNYAKIINGKNITHEIRFWNCKNNFINPVYERVDARNASISPIVIYSNGSIDLKYAIEEIEKWKFRSPLSSSPYYYEACVLFSQKKYDKFFEIASHYMFQEKEESLSKIMIRYYYAMACLLHKRSYKPALQNLNLCLCSRPLMAEFWCLMADVYYHLLHKFVEAKEFYENAIIMGSRRSSSDIEPMDLDKYKSYPNKMIKSCELLIANKINYAQMSRL